MPARLLVQEDLPQVGQPATPHLLRHVQRPEAELGGALPELQPLLLGRGEGTGLLDLLDVGVLHRTDLPVDEVAQGPPELQDLLGDVQHAHAGLLVLLTSEPTQP